jgi:hypothetical protein
MRTTRSIPAAVATARAMAARGAPAAAIASGEQTHATFAIGFAARSA